LKNREHTRKVKTPGPGEAETVKVPLDRLETQLQTSPNGLGQAEAQRRLEQYGYNELAEETANPLLKLLSYFWGPIPWMIEAAAVLSAVVQHWADLGIILALLIVNAVAGFWEEYQAGNTIEALKARLAPDARAKRDGQWSTIPARELVRATSSGCASATSSRPTPGCCRAIRCRSTSRL
jgi:H+-transporting ATPase